MSRNHVVAYKQGGGNTATIYTQEQAFLHNGRLDDIGEIWAWPPDTMGFSVVLRQPSWVSHLVLYLNNAEPANTYRTIAIHANNMETKLPELVAMVRGNDKRFVVVHFEKPILTDSIRILPKHPGHHECLTEVEVYGPLGGPEMASAGATPDPDAWPMLMATPARVPAKLPGDLLGEYAEIAKQNVSPTFQGSSTVVDGVFTFGGPTGSVGSIRLPADFKTAKTPAVGWGPGWGLQTVAPLGTPARHLGRLIVGSADYKVHAVADNGTYLWGFPTGGRVYSSPLTSGDDVYVGSDDGKLYKLDVHSGALLWEFTTGAAVRGSPAMADGRVFFTSGDGSLYAVDAESGLVAWKAAIAPNTRASAAVAGGRVYVGDEAGNVYAFDAKAGSPVWKQTLNGYVSYAPLVTPEGVVFVSEQGDVVLLGGDGNPKWKQPLNARVLGQPIATQSQVVLPTVRGLVVLARSDGQLDARFKPPPQAGPLYSALVYRDAVLMVMATSSTRFDAPPRTYAQYWGQIVAWRPKPAEGGK